MRKLSGNWVPKCLNADKKRQRCQSTEQLLEFFRRYPNDFLSRLVTMDETWLYHYDPETKQQSMECKNPPEKFLASIFSGSRRHPSHCLSSKGPNYQRGILIIFAGATEGHFEGKTPREGHQGGLHDNAPAHLAFATQTILVYLGFRCLDYPPYSPDLAPSDYHLFRGLKKKQLKVRHFSSEVEVIAAAETRLDRQRSEFFFFEWLAEVGATG